MSDIELHKRYPLSRSEDITDAYMRGVEVGRKMGRGTCHDAAGSQMAFFSCSACGATINGKNPRFCFGCGAKVVPTCCVESFDDGTDEGIDGEWYRYAPPTWTLSCGHTAEGDEVPSCCPTCGAKVVDE